MSTLKIAAFNINGGRSRLPCLLQWLDKEAPDIVCLQELKAADDTFPITEIHDAGYGAIWQGQRSWKKEALLQPESRDCYLRLLAQGWTDAVRARYPDERIYTFWDYFRQHWERNSGLRIDHLLLSAYLAPRLKAAGVDLWVRDLPKPSDHAPTWVTLDMKGGKKRSAP